MAEFRDVCPTSKDEKVRAWCIEKALEKNYQGTADTVILNTAAAIEHYVTTGEVTHPQLEAVYTEGLIEGRLEVREAVSLKYGQQEVDMPAIFKAMGWNGYDECAEEGSD